MRVELLYFEGCPGHERLQPRLEDLIRDAGLAASLELRRIESDEAARAERFLGSPTVRVNGRDIEPGADQRMDFGLKCRLYRSDHGASAVPPEEWIAAALSGTAAVDLEDLAAVICQARSRFDAREQHLALALYRLLAEGAPVSAYALAQSCNMPAAEVSSLLDSWPEVFRDREERVVAFAGLSLEATKHRFAIQGRTLYTWCAWDTLFLPELLGRTAKITSECPATGKPVELSVTPAGIGCATAPEAVLSMRAPTDCCVGDDMIARFCQYVHFLVSRQAAEQWLAEREDAFALSIQQGFTLGRIANHTNFAAALA